MFNKKISVAIIDDSSAICILVSRILSRSNEFILDHCFSNAEDAIVFLSDNPVDIVLMDIDLPKMSGIMCVRILKKFCPQMLFVMYTASADDDMVFEALKAGAVGYLLKETDPHDLLSALHELYNGGSPMSTSIARKIVRTFQDPLLPTRSGFASSLTDRENELLKLLNEGYRYKEIADKLFISIETVRRHCQNIYKKLQVQSKVEAINKVYPR
jgi:DNA-binding NarL/FixJ family response regulator